MKSDAQIQQDVLKELQWDPRVEETDVGVEVDRGVVTLTEVVGSYVKRHAAEEAAHRVLGVLDVANDVEVVLPGAAQRTDTAIAQAIRHALEWDVVVPETRIHSTVSDGQVTLEGEVDTWHEREAAERAVRGLTGVRSLVNLIMVSPAPVDAEVVRHEIREALERRAERTARHLTVDVRDGTVTLAGPVRSWAEREAVLGAALDTAGIRRVNDRLYEAIG